MCATRLAFAILLCLFFLFPPSVVFFRDRVGKIPECVAMECGKAGIESKDSDHFCFVDWFGVVT